MQVLYNCVVKVSQDAKVSDQQYSSLDSLVAICFMVELEYHSTAECYVHGMPDRKVLGMKNCEIHEIDMT